MLKVKLSPFAQKGKIHHTQIKMAAMKLEVPTKVRKNRDCYKTVDIDGNDIYLTYQWQEDDGEIIIFVKNAKYPKGKKKR